MKGWLNKIELHASRNWQFVLILQNPCLILLHYRRKVFIDWKKKKPVQEFDIKHLSRGLCNCGTYKHMHTFSVTHHPTKLILSICLKDSFYYSEPSSLLDFTVNWDFFQVKKKSIILIFLAYALFSFL